ncbi:bifunctional [glutamate--ammonia ligase]-adenylyl-L-tyrosine phosphorylase/[glutamate--ammonia-ligase] adenylyltransferase [Desulforhabdus sp. TSK]|uniref:bifunctional [glutamate--ammonia ligase]-adenylyl-L-tyrosine phosphorylase/[glutamate--ammonia-ligase] adenylyltransferase n=1 Tax=Desulforhabdus sp. TSK TaxID=2925014 RepID=UPI001FC81068|nr:bifunctional [glutamate--ammonia ligase]-adenylyl-L-tyrosine phosphorylase/[glutamate--ammonia-ligase] adenylyltransferase [Desulforhabdus sp. TSK]GKT07421.1 hypothetical protein DSTSK_07260 [Desulforhabdus sp. TSK]
MNEIERIEASSQYLATLIRRSPDAVDWLWNRRNLYRRYPLTGLYKDLLDACGEPESFSHLLACFREFKQRHFLRIGGRDFLGLASLEESTSQVSDLACVALQVGLEILMTHPQWWAGDEGIATWLQLRDDLQLTVMGLGKLGGQELNYVSDVDLIFLYASRHRDGLLAAEAPVLLNRLCQWLIRLLSDRTGGDRVFEVDMRLRPQGKDGPLVPSLAAAADHYLHHGHPWERQMLLKARPVAGDRALGMAFLQEVRPFVFRRFLDFQALDELRAMRDRILAEAVGPGKGWQQFDVKLGVGGIREIEFLVQSMQLVYGGRHPELDEANTLRSLERLKELNLLPASVVEELEDSYRFLRRVEHWVQLDQNRQTQKLPQSQEARRRLSLALGFDGDEQEFLNRLESCCTIVHGHFMALFQPEEERADPQVEGGGEGGEVPGEKAEESFSHEIYTCLQTHLKRFNAPVRECVLGVLHDYRDLRIPELREKVLLRLERYFGQVVKRPGLAKVFKAPAPWLRDICRGVAVSELLAELLAHHPSLVEGVATVAGGLPPFREWEATGTRLLQRAKDLEEGLEWLRRLKNERQIQLILADLRGDLDHAALEGELSVLADFFIRHTYRRILDNLQLPEDLPLSVLSLGKLGSSEMSYLSDLDLVFVYDPQPGEPQHQIPPEIVRLSQRFMRMLSTPLHEGPGYAVDARLRPTGNYGPLIVTRSNWSEYYDTQADLWEIQALLRVRPIAGHVELGRWIEGRAREICTRQRSPEDVWGRICHLRGRMQRERSDEKGEWVDLKLGAGGLADIEFLAQGILLTEGWRNAYPDLRSVRSALPRVLETVGSDPGLAPGTILSAFESIRSLDHRLRLLTNSSASRLNPQLLEALQLLGLWPPRQGGSSMESWEDLLRLRRRVREGLLHFCPEL